MILSLSFIKPQYHISQLILNEFDHPQREFSCNPENEYLGEGVRHKHQLNTSSEGAFENDVKLWLIISLIYINLNQIVT